MRGLPFQDIDMATRELAHFGIGFFPIGLLGFDPRGRVGKHGPVEHGRHRSRRVDKLPRAWRRSSWFGTPDLRGSSLGHDNGGGSCDQPTQPGTQGKTILHDKFSKKKRKHLRKGLAASMLQTYFGLWSQEMGGLKPRAGSALVKAIPIAAGTP